MGTLERHGEWWEVAAGPLGGISFWRTRLRGWGQASGLHHGERRGITLSDDGCFGEAWGVVGSGGGAAGGDLVLANEATGMGTSQRLAPRGGGASRGAVRGAFWGPFLGILQSRFLLLRLAKKTA